MWRPSLVAAEDRNEYTTRRGLWVIWRAAVPRGGRGSQRFFLDTWTGRRESGGRPSWRPRIATTQWSSATTSPTSGGRPSWRPRIANCGIALAFLLAIPVAAVPRGGRGSQPI